MVSCSLSRTTSFLVQILGELPGRACVSATPRVSVMGGSELSERARGASSIDMYNNDGGKKFMKQTGALKAATLYFAS